MAFSLHGRRVLIIDDDPEILELLCEYFELSSAEPKAFKNVQSAWSTLDDGYEPDLVLSDVNIGTENGITFATQLQQRSPQLPIVIMSADSGNEMSAREQGLLFVTKPFSFNALYATFAIACAMRMRREELAV